MTMPVIGRVGIISRASVLTLCGGVQGTPAGDLPNQTNLDDN